MSPAIEDRESDFLVRRDDLRVTRVRESPLDIGLDDGEARMTVDRFALTANNVTYGMFGDAMSYWDFFPSGEDGWGRIPAWGFGTVVASRAEGVAVGERFYGYFPMSTHLTVKPTRVKASGFSDGSAHRAQLHPLYNQYTGTATDPLYEASQEALQMLLRPLFITSFVIDDLLADNAFFGARAVILSSASSKTAYGCAWQLSQRRPDGPEVVALTSARNAGFVEGLGCYNRVTTYDAITSLPPDLPVAYVDFAGDASLRTALHRHFGDALRSSLVVGASHGNLERPKDEAPLPGAKPVAFFAPAQIKKRSGEWGADGFQQRFAEAWRRFTARVGDPARPWLHVVDEHGVDAVVRTYRDFVDGDVRPAEGRIVSMQPA